VRPSYADHSRHQKKRTQAPLERGRREDRVRAAPAVSRAKSEQNTHTSIQVQRKQSGLPCAMVLRLISRSPRRSAFLPPSSLRSLLLKNLMPASRHQNHTTSPSASVPFVLRHSRVHRSPRPTSVTIAIRPSCGHGMTENKHVIWVKSEAKYFWKWGWTAKSVTCLVGQISLIISTKHTVILRCARFLARLEGWPHARC
jgi:hypothetical protein